MVCSDANQPKIIKKTPLIQKLSKKKSEKHPKIIRKPQENYPQITPKSFQNYPPRRILTPPKLQVKIGINNNNNTIISCTAVQLFQEFIILSKGWQGLRGLSPRSRPHFAPFQNHISLRPEPHFARGTARAAPRVRRALGGKKFSGSQKCF